MKRLLLATLAASMTLAGACSRQLETPTPPGYVPPPPPEETVVREPGAPGGPPMGARATAPEATRGDFRPVRGLQDYNDRYERGRWLDTPRYETEYRGPRGEYYYGGIYGIEYISGSTERFREAYEAEGRPRIAVYLNRELSDDVREWRDRPELVILGGRKQRDIEENYETDRREDTGGIAAYSRGTEYDPGRHGPDEAWMWGFEDGFVEPFLEGDAVLVDRATILRLTAADTRDTENYEPLRGKRLEMDALRDYADIFIEVLVSRSPRSVYGYEFRAIAKEVNTGRIVAQASSARWRPEDRKRKTAKVAGGDYQVIEEIEIPATYEIAGDLAVDLLNAMSRRWEPKR